MKPFFILFTFLIASFCTNAQFSPVSWNFESVETENNTVELVATAELEAGWFIYSKDLELSVGPQATKFNFENNQNIKPKGSLTEIGKKITGLCELTQSVITKISTKAQYKQQFNTTNATEAIKGTVSFMVCTNESCLPPQKVPFSVSL